MNLRKTGNFIAELRKSKGLTQKEIAEKIGVLPKTVSKWETGHGFPDVSLVTKLAEILGATTDAILFGELSKNVRDNGNMKRIRFYVCADCGNIIAQTGNGEMLCCGKKLDILAPKKPDEHHRIQLEEIEDDFYITWEHRMEKEHYIHFIAYVRFDRILLVKLYPEQNGEVRFPKMYGGKIYYYCNKDGLFEYM